MRWIFLIGDNPFNINILKELKYYGSVSSYNVGEGRFCVHYGNEHVFYDSIIDLDDFEEDINIIPYINPAIVMMTYTSSDIVRKILMQDDFPKEIYIDNDLGLIVPLKEFMNLGMPMN